MSSPKKHVCKRCFYSTSMKRLMREHLSRINVCEVAANGQDIDQKTLYDELGDIKRRIKNLPCEFCKQLYSSPSSLCTHRKKCPKRFGSTEQTPVLDQATFERMMAEYMKKNGLQFGTQNNAQGNITTNSNSNNLS